MCVYIFPIWISIGAVSYANLASLCEDSYTQLNYFALFSSTTISKWL